MKKPMNENELIRRLEQLSKKTGRSVKYIGITDDAVGETKPMPTDRPITIDGRIIK